MINNVKLTGILIKDLGEFVIANVVYKKCIVKTTRLSGNTDEIEIVYQFDEHKTFSEGDIISATGSLRTKNIRENNSKMRLETYVFVNDINFMTCDENGDYEKLNTLEVEGTICRMPKLRKISRNRDICETLIAICTPSGKGRCSYPPVIAFDDMARKCSQLKIGDKIHFSGRLQSRDYTKIVDGKQETRMTYEIVINNIITVMSI